MKTEPATLCSMMVCWRRRVSWGSVLVALPRKLCFYGLPRDFCQTGVQPCSILIWSWIVQHPNLPSHPVQSSRSRPAHFSSSLRFKWLLCSYLSWFWFLWCQLSICFRLQIWTIKRTKTKPNGRKKEVLPLFSALNMSLSNCIDDIIKETFRTASAACVTPNPRPKKTVGDSSIKEDIQDATFWSGVTCYRDATKSS